MNSPYPLKVCKTCRNEGRRNKVETINGYCFREPYFCYQKSQKLKYTQNLAKEQVRLKKYAAKQLEKQKEKVYKKPSVRIEFHTGEEWTLQGKQIENPAKKRTPSNEKSISKLIQEATEVFNRWIRHRDCPDGYGHCTSCNEVVGFEEMQCGHMWPKGANGAVRFDEINNNGQCNRCNVELHGNQTEYLKALYVKYGSEEIEALAVRAKMPFKWDRSSLIEIIETYKNKPFLSKAS